MSLTYPNPGGGTVTWTVNCFRLPDAGAHQDALVGGTVTSSTDANYTVGRADVCCVFDNGKRVKGAGVDNISIQQMTWGTNNP